MFFSSFPFFPSSHSTDVFKSLLAPIHLKWKDPLKWRLPNDCTAKYRRWITSQKYTTPVPCWFYSGSQSFTAILPCRMVRITRHYTSLSTFFLLISISFSPCLPVYLPASLSFSLSSALSMYVYVCVCCLSLSPSFSFFPCFFSFYEEGHVKEYTPKLSQVARLWLDQATRSKILRYEWCQANKSNGRIGRCLCGQTFA